MCYILQKSEEFNHTFKMICEGIVKILMFIINSVVFLAGAAIVVMGVLVAIGKKNVLAALVNNKDLAPELTQLGNAGYILIAVGAVLIFMGFLGCCGACCENKCMLMTFFIIILIVFVAEVVEAVLILLLHWPVADKLLNKICEEVAESIKKNYGRNDVFTTAWNETMSQLKCCGYNNYTDFTGSEFVTRTSLYPQNCCSTTPEQCDVRQAKTEPVDGCFNAVVKLVKNNLAFLAGVAIFVAAIEVAAMIMSLILYKKQT